MFEDLLINSKTKAALETFAKQPAHALLLLGPAGSGKLALGKHLAAGLLNIKPAELDKYAYFLHIARQEKKQDISVEAIRELIKSLKLKVPSSSVVKRVVLVEDAHLMNQEAQNAFLKSLEEPAPGTVFILTSLSKNSLLPTVVSRATSITVEPVNLEQAAKFYAQKSQPEVAAAWALSQGAPGLLNSLLLDKDNDVRQAVNQAKSLLTKNKYQRLVELDKISDKAELQNVFDGMTKVLKALYRAAAAKNDQKRMDASLKAAKLVLEARRDIEQNAMPRLVILRLVLAMPL